MVLNQQLQPSLFENFFEGLPDLKSERSGSFVDNMTLPVHRWYRYSAGFAAEWVKEVLINWEVKPENLVLDPFAGSGTVSIVCDTLGINSVGVEAHPVVARISKAKLQWTCDPLRLDQFAREILSRSENLKPDLSAYPELIHRSFDNEILAKLDTLKRAWTSLQDSSAESELLWLVLTAILRQTSKAGTAQWQYILPNKGKKKVVDPQIAFRQQLDNIKVDIVRMQSRVKESRAKIIVGDARDFANSFTQKVDAVITSPPYANNYDYADALRFEMTFWGEVNGWGDLHDTVRKYLIVSSSQHSSREKLKIEELMESEAIRPIRGELGAVMGKLAKVREDHGGKKHYHTMVGAYFRDISLVLRQLRVVSKEGTPMCWVIGDSAPYGVYCSVDEWIGELALAAGFKDYSFEKLRDRNTKWKNRKHRVPLKEGLLWIKG